MRRCLLAVCLLLPCLLGCLGTETTNPPPPNVCLGLGGCESYCQVSYLDALHRETLPPGPEEDASCEVWPGAPSGLGVCRCGSEREVPSNEPAPGEPTEWETVTTGYELDPSRACLFYGRNRRCLIAGDDVDYCELSAGEAACEASCAEVARLRDADTAPVDAVLYGTACRTTSCACVMEIEGRCFIDGDVRPYDCALGVEAITDDYYARLRGDFSCVEEAGGGPPDACPGE